MKKVEAIVRSSKLHELQEAFQNFEMNGMMVLADVKSFGKEKGHSEFYRGTEYQVNFVPKTKIEIICNDEDVEKIKSSIVQTSHTGKVGDGKIIVTNVENVTKIRTGEQNEEAI